MSIATPVDLRPYVNGGARASAAHWHPIVAEALASLPEGPLRCWGLPFAVAPAGVEGADPPRWLLVGAGRGIERTTAATIELRSAETVGHLVFLHFCDETYDPAAGPQPQHRPAGSMIRPGQHVADYVLTFGDGGEASRSIRWRFEISETGWSWGQQAFAARPNRQDRPLDFRGTHPGQEWGRVQKSAVGGGGRYWVYALPEPSAGGR
ncbi:MAG: hypothetical protein CL878_13260, partial [Dehalococcoidia bacterium]|nr:hypothetical protein [Dehalococcoidia bacterium]